MMNDFGVPMSDAEMTMQPIKPHEEMMAASGVQSNWVGAAIGIGASIFGGMKASSAAKKQAREQNKAAQRQFEYDTELWEMSKDKLTADHAFLLEGIDIKKRNEAAIAKYTDKVTQQKYAHNLAIWDYQNKSQQAQFNKSEEVFAGRLNQNEQSAQAAREGARTKFEELQRQVSFDYQDQQIEHIMTMNAVSNNAGLSRSDFTQSKRFLRGYSQAKLYQTVLSGSKNFEQDLKEIALDKSAANLTAFAQRMLKPGVLPKPPAPLPTPTAEWQMPRALEEYDFGPAPVMGAQASVSAAGSAAFWGSAGKGIASGAAKIAGGINWGSLGGDSTYGTGIPNNTYASASDVELKENITYINQSPDGHSIYEWNYKGEPKSRRYKGVIAQDLLETAPNAVVEMDNGYLGVIYDEIDVNLTTV